MVYKCCVPRCKGNYENGPRVAIFSFPKTTELQQKWIAAIHRENFEVTQNSKVCELHFTEDLILRRTEYFDSSTGKKYSVPLPKPRLKLGAIPSILPNCPKYLSSATTSRESGDERRERLENRDLQVAIAASVATHSQYEQERRFVDFNGFLKCVVGIKLPNDWHMIKSETAITFILLETKDVPTLLCSVVVNSDLLMSLYVGKSVITKLGSGKFPSTVNHLNDLINTIDNLENFTRRTNGNSATDHLLFITDYLKNMTQFFEEIDNSKINFLCEQVNLLGIHKNHNRYSSECIIFCSILFSISPHAYRFIRSTQYLVLPHPNTLQKICSNFQTNPAAEQIGDNFLLYMKQKFQFLCESDHVVSLMVDEIHLKPYMDFTGGSILGAAFNSKTVATSAQVFMIQSLLSSYKDVVHILPVRNINGEELFTLIKKTISGLHAIGFKVVCVVSDNNSVNRRAMSFFASPPQLSIVYKHPCNDTQPLFYILDSVHILKCVRNNWINKKDPDQTIMYPQFETVAENTQLCMARFSAVKKLHDIECSQMIKYANKLNLKSLYPSNLERQNVKLVLNIFNQMTVQGLLALGENNHIESYESTAEFIKLICTWWSIVNINSPGRDIRFNDPLQKPLSSTSGENVRYLESFLSWLDRWKHFPVCTFRLSNDTHLAISHTTHALLELTKYCTEELNFKYLLPGKIQTDALEARFGKYRTMAGSQYLVSLRQVFEIESKLRIQTLLSLKISSCALGEVGIDLDFFESDCVDDVTIPPSTNFDSLMEFSEEQIQSAQEYLPVFTYLSGYCARAVLKKLRCETCKKYLVLDKTLEVIQTDESYELIRNVDRGGLYCPNDEVINAVICTYLVITNLVSGEHEHTFMRCSSQRNLVTRLAIDVIKREDFFLREFFCSQVDHTDDRILQCIVKVACNIFLNNYVKKINDSHNANNIKKRKLSTVK